jgi:hypothetical protein
VACRWLDRGCDDLPVDVRLVHREAGRSRIARRSQQSTRQRTVAEQLQRLDDLTMSAWHMENGRHQPKQALLCPDRVKGAQTRSCSSPVLVEQAAEQVTSMHSAALVVLTEDGQPGGRIWGLQSERPVGTVAVVMLDVDPQDLLQVASTDDQ